MDIVEQYQINLTKFKNLKLDIEIYENDYLNLGDTKEHLDKLKHLKKNYKATYRLISSFEHARSVLSREESLFIQYVYVDRKPYVEFACELFDINITEPRLTSFCSIYKQYLIRKLEKRFIQYGSL